jgi:hypothetical protein
MHYISKRKKYSSTILRIGGVALPRKKEELNGKGRKLLLFFVIFSFIILLYFILIQLNIETYLKEKEKTI